MPSSNNGLDWMSSKAVTFPTLDVANAAQWHSWLSKNHLKSKGIWLIFHRKDTGIPSLTYEDALDWALAYGWIDSLIRKIDEKKYARKFTPRKPWSIWSNTNINRVSRLKQEGKMSKWGLQAFEKKTSEKSLLEQFNEKELEIPKDLSDELRANSRAWKNFREFTPGYRRRYLIWISGAKKSETRQRRISEAVDLIAKNVKALLK